MKVAVITPPHWPWSDLLLTPSVYIKGREMNPNLTIKGSGAVGFLPLRSDQLFYRSKEYRHRVTSNHTKKDQRTSVLMNSWAVTLDTRCINITLKKHYALPLVHREHKAGVLLCRPVSCTSSDIHPSTKPTAGRLWGDVWPWQDITGLNLGPISQPAAIQASCQTLWR